MSTYATKLVRSPTKVISAKTEDRKQNQSDNEKEKYEFRQLPNSEYLSLFDAAKDTFYVLKKTGKNAKQEIQCSCEYFKETGNTCEHLLAMRDIDMNKLDATEDLIIEFLRATDWHDTEDGRFVPPENDESTHISNDAGTTKAGTITPEVVKELKGPMPEPAAPAEVSVRCPYCDTSVTRSSQYVADSWLAKHLLTCKKNPANIKEQETKTPVETPPETETPSPPPDAPEPAEDKKHTCKICGKEYDTIDGVLNCIESHKGESGTSPVHTTTTSVTSPPLSDMPEPAEDKKRVCEICGDTFDTIDALLNHVPGCKRAHEDAKEVEALPALIANMDWTAAEVEVMRKTVANNATIEEFAYFLNVAKAVDLNPFLKEIYFMKTDKGQVAIITGRDGFLKIAKRDPNFEGLYSMEVCEKDEFSMSFEPDESGRMVQTINHKILDFTDRGEIIGAWAQAQTRGIPSVVAYATRKEYDRKKDIWLRFPAAMMRKVPESMVLRRIAGISGVVGEAEIGDGTIVETTAEVI